MSFYSDASLAMIPSGVKDQKVYSTNPTDGSGDLTFSRSNDTATRVNSSGLIEKVRTNLLLQSNSFSTTWATTNASVTSGQSGYDGTSNAWRLQVSSTFGWVSQTISLSGLSTISVYAKAGTVNILRIQTLNVGTDAFFNVATGTIGTLDASVVDASIESVGNGYYRCSVTYNETIVEVKIMPQSSEFVVNSGDNILIQSAQLESGDIATDYIATTSSAVSVGPVANLPRLDYSGGATCPKLLLEPQRTNLYTYSEQFDNANWGKTNVSVTANNTASPDGYTNADKVVADTTNGVHRIEQDKATATQVATQSVFAKASGYNFIALENGGELAYFNISTGVVGSVTAGTASIQNYGNGWFRCIFTATALNTKSYIYICSADSVITFAGDNTSGAYLYGAQFEANASYASSYVNTLGAASTRGEDSCYKTSASALIGATAGTMFIEVENNPSAYLFTAPNNVIFGSINSGDYLNNFHFTTDNASIYLLCNASSGVLQTVIGTTLPTTSTLKMAVTYTSSAIKFFLNGALVGTDTSFTLPSSLSRIDVGYMGAQPTTQRMRGGTKQFLLFDSALSDSDAITLTTI